MKLIKFDAKKNTIIKTQTTEDLYALCKIIKKNDIVGAKTFRTEQKTSKKQKVSIFLKIIAEKINLSKQGDILNIGGKIIEAKDIVQKGHHTLHIGANNIFHIEKKWNNLEIHQLKQCIRYKKTNILIVNIDERNALIAKANEERISSVCNIKRQNAGKQYNINTNEYFGNCFNAIQTHLNNANYLIIAGPGFAASDFFKYICENKKEKVCNLLKNTIVDKTSIVGKTGLNEIIARGIMDRVVKNSILSEQIKLVENIFEALAKKPEKVAYGIDYVNNAIKSGAAKQLLISDKIISNKNIEELIELAKEKKINFHIIETHHNAGERLYELGGIVALLRYKI
ncbi:MAG: mRNA surveillance protein pelota [Candidatus Aenigmarchaeota archaeon ex4484_52]|nr:MAG: mRNA surveillance protein pelota [Candidatus Aenigmarchaeota archaeon ex4484_52]